MSVGSSERQWGCDKQIKPDEYELESELKKPKGLVSLLRARMVDMEGKVMSLVLGVTCHLECAEVTTLKRAQKC